MAETKKNEVVETVETETEETGTEKTGLGRKILNGAKKVVTNPVFVGIGGAVLGFLGGTVIGGVFKKKTDDDLELDVTVLIFFPA